MKRYRSIHPDLGAALALASILLVSPLAFDARVALAKAPTSKDVMEPVDTSAGSITDSKHTLQVDLDRQVSVDVSNLPLEVALHQVGAILGLEWGYTQGVNQTKPVSVAASGSARSVLKAIGRAAGVRFDVNGPTQIRLLQARSAPPQRHSVPAPKHP